MIRLSTDGFPGSLTRKKGSTVMRTAAVIAEYNPFHNGHAYQLKLIRERTGAEHVIVLMSGYFVQRGEPAMFSRSVRTRMALEGGADLVLELPVQYACASAEAFASGGTGILDRLGVVDDLCFGAETPDPDILLQLSEWLVREPPEFKSILREGLKSGRSFPCARMNAILQSFSPLDKRSSRASDLRALLTQPNNILALEYCKALIRLDSSVRPVVLPRTGSDELDTCLHRADSTGPDRPAASAMAIRNILIRDQSSGADAAAPFLPEASLRLIKKAMSEGTWLSRTDLDAVLGCRLMRETGESLVNYQDVTRSLAGRIMLQRHLYKGFDSFAGLLKTKDATLSGIRRALLHIVLELPVNPPAPSCVRVLGFKKSATGLIRQIQEKGSIPLAVKPADSAALRADRQAEYSASLYEMLLALKAPDYCFRRDLTQSPVVL